MKTVDSFIALFLFCMMAPPLQAQPINDSLFTQEAIKRCRLVDAATHTNRTLNETNTPGSLFLFVFLSPECPLCRNYAPVLDSIARNYGVNLRVTGIVPGKTYTATDVNAYARKYKLSFPVLIDPQKKLTRYLQAAATPEVILLNHRYELVYRGGIDNRVKQLGAQRDKATENYLSDAVSQYLQHTGVTVKRTKAIGCLINDF